MTDRSTVVPPRSARLRQSPLEESARLTGGRGLPVALLMTVALLASVSWARGQFVELNPPPSFIDGDPRTWTASMTVTGRRVVTLRVALPEAEELVEALEPVDDVDARVFHRGRGHWEVHARDVNETKFELTLQGPANRFRNAANVRYTWHVQGRAHVPRLFNGPVPSGPPAHEAAVSRAISSATEDRAEFARLRLFRDGNRIFWGSGGGSRFEAQISGDVVLDDIHSASLVEEALAGDCLWSSRDRSRGSHRRCEYSWDTETYGSFLARLRMQREPSTPVSPSFVPKLTVQRVGLKRLSRTTASMWVIRLVPIAHHSNGQDGCELLGQERAEKGECVGVSGSEQTDAINIKDGSFSTNYTRLSLHRGWLKLDARNNIEGAVDLSVTLERHHSASYLPGALSEHVEPRYGKTRLAIGAGFAVWEVGLPFASGLEMRYRFQKIMGVPRGGVHVVSGLVSPWEARPDVGLYVQYHKGRDYYNIRFEERLERVAVGLAFNWQRLGSVRLPES